MKFPTTAVLNILATALACGFARAADTPVTPAWRERHDQLVARLRALAPKEGDFGAAYQPLYHAAISWYELWGGRNPNPVDDFMVSPDTYAAELAASLEQERNYFADNPSALFPLVFRETLPNGEALDANYWLSLPAGFPTAGRRFPLFIQLHGSGWLGHKISFTRGKGPAGPGFAVTPIDMDGPWKIEFLNAYLDELITMLPIDTDRVYVSGHSLGGMATWEWALNNPWRFAAIAPTAGIGEPYRAIRLKNLPAWVIHGEKDDVVPNGFADEMVTAMQACGAPVRYSLIRGGPHNMPADMDSGQILEWYLRQTRSPLSAPPDPRDALGLNADGYSPVELITQPATPSWQSAPLGAVDEYGARATAALLFKKVHERGELVDAPLRVEWDRATNISTMWLAVPRTLHPFGRVDPSIIVIPASHYYRFYYRGTADKLTDHLKSVQGELEAEGHALSGKVWMTHLSIWWDTRAAISECWVEAR